MLKLHAEKLGSVVIVSLDGRLVRGRTAALRESVEAYTAINTVVLDLARVSVVDAGGLSALLEIRRHTQSKGIDFKLMNLTKRISRVLEIARLNSVFEVQSPETGAFGAVASQSLNSNFVGTSTSFGSPSRMTNCTCHLAD